MLQVKNGRIVDAQGSPVYLRGACVGGWMNMENFINGYPGAEHALRATMAETLGGSKAEFFFDRLLDYFLAEDDIAFMKASGATVVRLSFNYRHFERDDDPFVYIEKGFRRMEQAVGWCQKHGLYAILDHHAVQGWQNTDWHCDNGMRHALFWDTPHYQDRFIALWEALADRFKGNPAVAGYNIMNEPQTSTPRGRLTGDNEPRWDKINALYARAVQAIRVIDPDHIIILEGDNFSSRFAQLDAPFAGNLLYSSHNYTRAGFGPGAYPRQDDWNREWQEANFLAHEGARFMQQYNVPLWVGEFGSPYNGPAGEVPDRMRALDDQIDVFEQYGVHWTTWTYKDVGVMGWVHLDPESDYIQRVKGSLETKRLLNSDFWMSWLPNTPAKTWVHNLVHEIVETVGDPDITVSAIERYVTQATMATYIGALLQLPYAKLFKGMSEAQLDQVLQSFAFKNCTPHPELHAVMRKHLG
ncbi:MAG: glycoside hydrolase family 5 protein [Anaerolineae bacterium]|nr:glycoside hydrolase family 5 protein [Anaerolineae bacterium]